MKGIKEVLLKSEGLTQQQVNETIGNLRTFLCWLQSVDCPDEVFDTVGDHGELTESLDEVMSTAATIIELFNDNT